MCSPVKFINYHTGSSYKFYLGDVLGATITTAAAVE
jgi:hypothetical protein